MQPFGHNTWAKIGGAVPLSGGAEFPFNTISPGPRPTPVPSETLIHAAVWPQHVGQYGGGVLCPPLGASGVPIEYNVAWAEVYHCTKWHLNPTGHLATTDVDRKLWVICLLGEGDLGPHLKQCGRGRGLPPCQVYS